MTGLEKAKLCASYAYAKKADDIVILDVSGLSTITDYFVICTAHSTPQLRAVRDEVDSRMRKDRGIKSKAKDGRFESTWIIIDFSDVLVHIFQGEQREFYALENLWSDAPRIEYSPDEAASLEAPQA